MDNKQEIIRQINDLITQYKGIIADEFRELEPDQRLDIAIDMLTMELIQPEEHANNLHKEVQGLYRQIIRTPTSF